LLAGLSADDLITVRSEIHLSIGAGNLINFLQAQGHTMAAVSGGFVDVIEPLMSEIGIANYHANKLEIIDGKLTGKILGAIVDSKVKSDTLVKFADQFKIPMADTVAIGDGANDIAMLQSAGVGIAFNAKPKLKEIADIVLDMPNLDAVIYLLGLSNLDVTSN
jgi:phosphoserine phosphatase